MSPEADAEARTEGAVTAESRKELLWWLGGVALAVAVILVAVVAMGGRIESATWGLAVAAAAMIFALRALYRMAMVLSRPPVEAAIEQEDVVANASVRELREERRRVLRAINELQFDYEMGKLAEADYRSVRQGYELRAVEVMRALDAETGLHPRLEDELRRRGLVVDAPAAEAPAAAEMAEAPAAEAPAAEAIEPPPPEVERQAMVPAKADDADEITKPDARGLEDEDEGTEASEDAAEAGATAEVQCAACERPNDPDARFCKHCGAKLGPEEASA